MKRPYESSDLRESKQFKDDVHHQKQVKKKMHALLLMYSGWGYFGMQRTPTHPTIEGELSKALLACGYLDDETTGSYKKIWFQRASKTDKSVSALGQVCSMLLPEDSDAINRLNAILPKHMRLLDILRTTRRFSAKRSCSHRIYEYLFPTFALAPYDLPGGDTERWAYRVTAERLTLANKILKHYLGCQNYYNFTSGRAPDDVSCRRYMLSVECLVPFLREDREYAVIRVAGQSFMLHQIRKMVGLMFAVVRGNAPEDIFENVFKTERMDIPRAPGLGLMLSRVMYDRYNQRFGSDKMHVPIDWEKYEDQMEAFKLDFIYSHIDKTEVEERSMSTWLDTLELHSYTYRPSESPIPRETQQPPSEPVISKPSVGIDSSQCSYLNGLLQEAQS